MPRRNGAIRKPILTSPMHLEYTTHMKGVDVVDQLWASYNSQTWSHKWWHRIFYFLLDMTIVNLYILYLSHAPSIPMHMLLQTRVLLSLLESCLV
jgi:hypothetical protein